MNYLNRKDNLLGRSRSESILRSALVVASLASVVGAAHAQSNASSTSAINYSFSVDTGSADPASDLVVTDNGQVTYNLIAPLTPPYTAYYSPYAQANGADASASTFDSPFTGYNGLTMSGYEGVGSYASESGPTGSAAASLGMQENLVLTDSGSNSITIDISAIGFIDGSATVTGAMGYATETSYAGIFAYDARTYATIDTHVVTLTTTSTGGPVYGETGVWAPIGPGEYYAGYQLTINGGQNVALDFYASGLAESTTQAVPAPTGVMTLGMGVAGLLLRRRKARR